jgi:hypothetical protein
MKGGCVHNHDDLKINYDTKLILGILNESF